MDTQCLASFTDIYCWGGGVRRKTSQKRAVEVESLTVEAHASAMRLTRGVIRCKEAQYKEAELVTSKVHI